MVGKGLGLWRGMVWERGERWGSKGDINASEISAASG